MTVNFQIDRQRCTRCGLCVADCPVRIIGMEDGYPGIAADREEACLRCQHCLAICPTAALSILGFNPDRNAALEGGYPEREQLLTLFKGRRSVRRYAPENLDPRLIGELLDAAWQAPTGENRQNVLLTVIDDRAVLSRFRTETYDALARLIDAGALPAHRSVLARFTALWQEKGIDVIFREAPHLVMASAPRTSTTPRPDCLIALSFFDLYAQNSGVGTLWNGFLDWTMELLPTLQRKIAIPEDHQFGYALLFGSPAASYRRTIERGSARINRVVL